MTQQLQEAIAPTARKTCIVSIEPTPIPGGVLVQPVTRTQQVAFRSLTLAVADVDAPMLHRFN